MFSHVMLGANDMEASKAFYDALLAELGQKPGVVDAKGRCFYFNSTGTFALTAPIDGEPACAANGGTIGFAAQSTALVDSWYAAGLANGGIAVEDPPGIRGLGEKQLYLAYLRDPSGNKICAMYRVPA